MNEEIECVQTPGWKYAGKVYTTEAAAKAAKARKEIAYWMQHNEDLTQREAEKFAALTVNHWAVIKSQMGE